MVRKVYGGQATIKKDQEEEIHDKILKLPIPDQQRVIDILTTLQGHGDNQGLIEKNQVDLVWSSIDDPFFASHYPLP